MLADSLPDTYGRALFDQWLKLTGRISSNPVETLCFLGQRCMGALEFEPATGPATDENMKFEIDSLVDVAREALSKKEGFGVNLDTDRKAAIAEILRLGTSAGGQRAKAIIAYNKETGEVRSGQITAPEGFDYYLIKVPYSQAQEMFRRVVFNVVLRNQDDHTKNISFLMDSNGQWRLSPAYDIGFAYNPEGAWTKTHQMSVNGKFDGLTRKDLLECAAVNNIKNAPEIIDQVCEVASGWPTLAKECGVPQTMIDAIVPHLLLKL